MLNRHFARGLSVSLVGLLILAAHSWGQYQNSTLSQQLVANFERLDSRRQETVLREDLAPKVADVVYSIESPNQADWSQVRIDHYKQLTEPETQGVAGGDETLTAKGVLTIDHSGTKIPIFMGADEPQITLGAGLVTGTALPEERGNTVLAAHRDGYFRALKDVTVGDEVKIQMQNRLFRYRITETFIVEPDHVDVLAPTEEATLTLVTCYPFYFAGHAPQRFIVRAELVSS